MRKFGVFPVRRRFKKATLLGAGVTEYLLVTVTIAAVVVPIAYRFFAEPVRDSLFKQRQTLVDFIAQTPKRPVPGVWFSTEKEAKPDPSELNSPGQLEGSRDLTVGDFSAPGELVVGELKTPGNLTVGSASGAGTAGGSSGAGGGGVGASSDSGLRSGTAVGGGVSGTVTSRGESGLSDNFFKGSDKKGATEGGESDASKQDYGAMGATGKASSTDSGGGEPGAKKSDPSGSDKGGKGETSAEIAKRQGALLMDQVNELDKRRAESFDWWFLIKFLVLCFILFLIILITLSNLKRR